MCGHETKGGSIVTPTGYSIGGDRIRSRPVIQWASATFTVTSGERCPSQDRGPLRVADNHVIGQPWKNLLESSASGFRKSFTLESAACSGANILPFLRTANTFQFYRRYPEISSRHFADINIRFPRAPEPIWRHERSICCQRINLETSSD